MRLAVPTPSSTLLQCCGGHEDEHCLVWRAVRGCHTLPFTVHRGWRIWVQRCLHWSAQTQQRLRLHFTYLVVTRVVVYAAQAERSVHRHFSLVELQFTNLLMG